jgi:uncharacterized protein
MKAHLFDSLREFAKPHYIDKDDLQNLDHVHRILTEARQLGQSDVIDDDLLVFGAYLHGLILTAEADVRTHLFSLGLDRDRVIQIMNVAWEAGEEAQPATREGSCLHDAHLIEGGPEYQIAKWLISGTLQGQHLPQLVESLEKRVIGRYQCTRPEAQERHAVIEEYRRRHVEVLKKILEKKPKDEADTAWSGDNIDDEKSGKSGNR